MTLRNVDELHSIIDSSHLLPGLYVDPDSYECGCIIGDLAIACGLRVDVLVNGTFESYSVGDKAHMAKLNTAAIYEEKAGEPLALMRDALDERYGLSVRQMERLQLINDDITITPTERRVIMHDMVNKWVADDIKRARWRVNALDWRRA